MRLILTTFCALMLTLGSSLLEAKVFTPVVMQFNKKNYVAGNQNWSVAQDSKGIIYFGNNEGLLRFDGSDFELIKQPSEQMIRSVFIDKKDRIYVGSFKEFGYYEKDKFGVLNYTSLSTKLANYKLENDEIWKIFEFKGKIFFQSFQSIFIFDGENIEGKSYDKTFLFIHPFKEHLYTHTLQNGFSRFDPNKKQFTQVENVPFSSSVIAVVPFNDKQAYVVTQSDGIYTFDGFSFQKFSDASLDFLKHTGVNKATLTRDSLLIVGTILDGVVAVDKVGRRSWTLNTSNNLQNNTVLGMLTDQENNLWLALDKGVAMVRLNTPVKFVQSFTPAIGAVYSLNFQPPNKMYIATNQGLYTGTYSQSNNELTNIQVDPLIKGQVWDLTNFDGQLFCGNNEETYQLLPDRKILSYSKGGMCISKGVIHGQEVLVQGTYSDICIYTKEKGKWEYFTNVKDFLNPIRSISIDYQGRIWAAHMHQGLFMIKLNPDLKTTERITEFNSLDNTITSQVNVYSINNRTVFANSKLFYIYDDFREEIVPYEKLNDALGQYSKAYKVSYQKPSTYWFIRKDEAALVEVKENDIRILDRVQYSLFQNQTVDDFQNIIPISDSIAMFTLENGLALYDVDNDNVLVKGQSKDIQLMEVLVLDKDSEAKKLLPLNPNANEVAFPHTKNRIRFRVSYPNFSYLNDLMFSYKLTGLNNNWSEMTSSNVKEYSYLRPGKYVFSVMVLTNNGNVLATKDYSFRVKPPFYWNNFSKIIYFIILLYLVYLVFYFIRKDFEKKQTKIQDEQETIRRKEIEKREQEIVKLKAERLEADLMLKSKELATSTMTIIRKNETLIRVKEELVDLKKHLGTQYPNKYYDRMIRLVDQNLSSDDDWAIFQTNFDRIHDNFFRNLHATYPQLTPNDLRFCAYFRLNLSTKDIANLMNISTKGVEVARYRIRKKINIPSDKNISEFLIEFK